MIGLLVQIYDNTFQKFKFGDFTYVCKPYGVYTLNELETLDKLPDKCHNLITNYFTNHPEDRNYAVLNLHIQQMYQIDPDGENCIMYSNATHPYSQELLLRGLALYRREIENKWWGPVFAKAQRYARYHELGIWSSAELEMCAKMLYPNEQESE